jgi:cytochrome c oxidase accessory protein FixG
MCCCDALLAHALAMEAVMTDKPAMALATQDAAQKARKNDSPRVQAPRSLYANREPVYPRLAHGKLRNIKWGVMIVTIGIYYGLPWLRWDRGPSLPDQAVLFDFPNQRLLFPGIEIWAQEFYFVTAILILAALALFLITAIAGRVWCGYACPQTVWTDLMIAVERIWLGDRNARLRLAKEPWSFNKAWRMGGTHLSWLIIAFLTGGAFVFYFRDAPTLLLEFWHFNAPAIAYIFLGLFTATTYLLGGVAREQVCTYMCPWPRIQGAMFDADSLLITYRAYRGEPRGAHKKGNGWEGRGDCVDCRQCVAVCPTGIDIRNGPQLECIQCALCIDACDRIMEKVGRPKKLIAYDTYRNLNATSHGGRAPIRLIRPRTLLYGGMFVLVLAISLFGLSRKTVLEVNVVPDRNPLFVQLSDGSIRDGYTLKLINKRHEAREFAVSVEGIPEASLRFIGSQNAGDLIEVKPGELRAVKVYVTAPESSARAIDASATLTFVVRDKPAGTEARHITSFRGPER